MSKYGQVALRATELVRRGIHESAREAWQAAAREVFPYSAASQAKGCPRAAYLGLCEEGLVAGVPPGDYGAGIDNKGYALEAKQLLTREPVLAEAGPASLWRRVMNGREKEPNRQMEVVLALWAQGLLAGGRKV